ncbi:MAG: PTS mannose transporter subunit IIB [Longicatena sp.]
MRKLVLASHGSLAEGMKSAAEMILGTCEKISAYGLDTYKNPIDIYDIVEKQISSDENNEYIVLCDINGGSVHNQMIHLCSHKNVYLLTGMTLSMVLEITLESTELKTQKLLEKVIDNAHKNMLIFNYQSVLKRIKEETEDDKLW